MKRSLKVFFFLLFLQAVTFCLADGCYFPSIQAFEGIPDIPQQRAFIDFRNGMETLIVESTLDSEQGSRFAWILPLPASPKSIESSNPGVLSALQFFTHPKIITETDANIHYPIVALIFSLLVTLAIITRNPVSRRALSDLFIILGIIALLALISVGDPMLGSSSLKPPSALVLWHERIGNYEVVVLKGDNSLAVDNWFRENEFAPLPEGSKPIIDQYAKENWVFLASRFLRTGTGLMTPHPLKVKFPSERPVYPMRLTALANSETELLLFVGSAKRFEHPKLNLQFADRIGVTSYNNMEGSNIESVDFHRNIYDYKELAEIMEGEEWLTCFKTRLKPGDMKDDLFLVDSDETAPYQDVFYSRGGAGAKSLSIILWIFTCAFPVIGIIFKNRRKAGALALLILICLGFVTYKINIFYLPVRENVVTSLGDYRGKRTYQSLLSRTLSTVKSGDYASGEEYRAAVLDVLEKSHANLFTGLPIREEHSPGNIEFRKNKDGGLNIVWYDVSCYGHTIFR